MEDVAIGAVNKSDGHWKGIIGVYTWRAKSSSTKCVHVQQSYHVGEHNSNQ